MDKEQFIKSGLLEQYVLGLTTAEEDDLVNEYLDKFPELTAEIDNLHQALLTYAANQDIPSPNSTKQSHTSSLKKKPFLSSLLLLPVLLLIGLLFWVYQRDQHHQMEVLQLEAEYATLEAHCQRIQDSHNSDQTIIVSSRAILLNPTQQTQTHFAIAYWNPERSGCWIDASQLPVLENGLQYQVWADVDGEMISIGLIPPKANTLITLDFIDSAESLNITIEEIGGADHPNVSLLTVNGFL